MHTHEIDKSQATSEKCMNIFFVNLIMITLD